MRFIVVLFGLLLAAGCARHSTAGDPATGPGDPTATTPAPPNYFAPTLLEVSGRVVDFEMQQPLVGAMTMATAALVPPPNVSVSGPGFTLDGVPPFSVFYLIAGSPPDHRLTYNPPTKVTDQGLTNVTASSVADAYLTKLRSAFGAPAEDGTATVLVHAVDANGHAVTGVPAAALQLGAIGLGPLFLDANLQPLANGAATSASGWLVYFDVPGGTLKLAGGSGYVVQAADTPTVGDAVSLVEATFTKGATPPPPPTNVSFQQTVIPVFMTRGCYNCHSGNGAGRRLGDLVLDGSSMKIWTALTQTISPNFHTTRVNLKTPDKSLVLTMPSYENPPDAHPTVVFTSSADADYQKILTWIKEGAKFN